MKPIDHWRLLPHELFFGFFLLATWMRLGLAVGFLGRDALLYLALIAANVWAMRLCRSNGTSTRWRLGLLFYPVAMNVVFFQMKTAIPKIHPERMDAWLQQIDRLGIGTNLSLRLQPLVASGAHRVLQLLLPPVFSVPALQHDLLFLRRGGVVEEIRDWLVHDLWDWFSRLLARSRGGAVPRHGRTNSQTPLAGWWITKWNAAIVAGGSNGVDVFPSLHCAVSSFLLFFDRRHRPWRFKLYLVPAVGLWLSTIYLRYHYLIDVLCGFALAAFALWLAQRYPRKPDCELPLPATPATPTADSTTT